MPKFILFTLLLVLSAPSFAAKKAEVDACVSATVTDESAHAGILMHGEHWVDLVLAQAASPGQRHLKAYLEILGQLQRAESDGGFEQVNEKIDGSPSLVAGFKDGRPFVAYKGHFSRAKNQVLITEASGDEGLSRSPALRKIVPEVLRALAPAMKKLDQKYHGLIFQGDLLFSGADERLQVSAENVKIQANTLTYEIPKDHPLYASLAAAKVGIVFHTVGRQVVREDGSLGVEAISEEEVVREFAQALNGGAIFAIDPWRENVEVTRLSIDARSEVAGLRRRIVDTLTALPESFRAPWSSKFLAKWRTYFNSGLRPPLDGGFYKAASASADVAPAEWIEGFQAWLRSREESDLLAQFQSFLSAESESLEKLILAYAAAVRIQALIQPSLHEATRSKLGGGDSEGLMLKTDDTIVKLVDRLGFTLLNNQRWNRGQAPKESFAELPAPFQAWTPGAIFITMKAQPVHGGHIAMIREIARLNPGAAVHVIASDKGPDLSATEWKKLGAADRKSDLAAREYTYIFDNELRRELLETGLKDSGVQVHILNPGLFWSYLRTAQAQSLGGKIKLGVGDKEIQAGRYDAQVAELGGVLELLALPAQEGGISATQVRQAIKTIALADIAGVDVREAEALLQRAFGYIPEKDRNGLIRRMVERWQQVDAAAQALIFPKKKAS